MCDKCKWCKRKPTFLGFKLWCRLYNVAAEKSASTIRVRTMKNILEEAQEIIYGDREKTYGDPGKNLRNIANLWEMYLHGRGLYRENADSLLPEDVANMMILLKIARLSNTPGHRDSLLDICGYAALVERIQSK